MFGGEGFFFATLTGPGTVWLQSLPFSRLAGRIWQAAPQAGGEGTGRGPYSASWEGSAASSTGIDQPPRLAAETRQLRAFASLIRRQRTPLRWTARWPTFIVPSHHRESAGNRSCVHRVVSIC